MTEFPEDMLSNDGPEAIVEALRAMFGVDAKTVARIQVEEAGEEGRAMWETILARLSM